MTIGENKAFIERYPFLAPRDFDGKIDERYDYKFTFFDHIPEGWRIAFGEQMLEEIRKELVINEALEDYGILQIKEKFGGLRWYDYGYESPELNEIIRKYEKMSYKTCISCGKPATKISRNWICPWCDECAEDVRDELVPIDEWFA